MADIKKYEEYYSNESFMDKVRRTHFIINGQFL